MTHVVTCFLRVRSRLLLGRRAADAETYPGRWAAVSGYVEGDPSDALADARRELREEVGVTDFSLVRTAEPFDVRDGPDEWTVYPFLFDAVDDAVTPSEEFETVEWVSPPTMLERLTVPGLWAAYRRVAPTLEDVREDTDHGSTRLSIRALEILRDVAAESVDWAAVAETARQLRDARPSMAVVENRLNRVVAEADRTPASVARRAEAALEAAYDADASAAAVVAGRCSTARTVLTLSRSETVLRTIRSVRPAVVIGESRSDREGVDVAEALADDGLDVTLTTDAALVSQVAEADVVLVGADAVLPDGSVVNKVGTFALALAADRVGVPCLVVTARDKVRTDNEVHAEVGRTPLYEGDAAVAVQNPLFERIPGELVTVVTETGVLGGEGLTAVVDEHRANATWDDSLR